MSVDQIAREVAQEVERQRSAAVAAERVRTDPSTDNLRALISRWRVVATITLAGSALATAYAFLTPTIYRAEATVLPSSAISSSSGLAQLGNLGDAATQLGLNLGGNGADPSALFPKLLRSRGLGLAVLSREYTGEDGQSRTLFEVLGVDEADERRRQERALRRFHSGVLRYGHDRKSGVSSVAVEMEDPVVAAAVANDLIDELDQRSREIKLEQAQNQVDFVSERVAAIAVDLAKSEERLREFRSANRQTGGSPTLMLEEARHMRDVELNQQLFITLKAQQEIALIEEGRNTPLIAVIDRAVVPVRRHAPDRAGIMLSGFFLSLILGAAAAVVLHQWTTVRRAWAGSA